MTTASAQHVDIVTHGFTTDFDRHAHHYDVVFRNETDHPLTLVAACHGGGDEWDVVRGGLVTFCGSAVSRPGASCAFATPSDGLIAVGPQGYMPGTHASVHAEYVLG